MQSRIRTADYTHFRFLATATAETPTTIVSVPVNNIVDNFSWNKGRHNFQFGGNWRLIHQNNSTNANSFSMGSSNPYWLGGVAPDFGDVSEGFGNSYLIAYANLVGTVPEVTDVITTRSPPPVRPTCLPMARRWKSTSSPMSSSGTFRTPGVHPEAHSDLRLSPHDPPDPTRNQRSAGRPNHRHPYLVPAAPDCRLTRPDLRTGSPLSPSGPYYNKPGYWPKNKLDIAPRIAVAYSPDPRTSIRGGFGLYFDHYGEALVNIFSQQGSFGLSSQVTNPASKFQTKTLPASTVTPPPCPLTMESRLTLSRSRMRRTKAML